MAEIRYDDVLEILGEFGRYQKQRFLLLTVVALATATHSLSMAFIGANVPFYCRPPFLNQSGLTANVSEEEVLAALQPPDQRCRVYNATEPSSDGLHRLTRDDYLNLSTVACAYGRRFQQKGKKTLVSEFDLVCEKEWIKRMSKSTFFLGRLFAAAFAGHVSDMFGRRPSFLLFILLQSTAGVAAAFSSGLEMFNVLYFIQGFGQNGAFLCLFIIVMEMVGPSYRVFTNFAIHISYSMGLIMLSGIAYFVDSWRHLELIISVPFLMFLSFFWFLPESPRWLLTRERVPEVTDIVRNIAETNRVALPDSLKIARSDVRKTKIKFFTFIDLLRQWNIARLSVNVWFNWCVNSLVYYGLSINVVDMGGNSYLNFCLAAAAEIPATLFAVALIKYCGRRKPLFMFMLVGGATCVSASLIPDDPIWIRITLVTIGKFAITASYNIVYLISAEVFPTVARNIGVGMSSLSARIGGAVAPFILGLDQVFGPLPLILFGSLSIVAGILALLLPETSETRLPQTLEESINLTRIDSCPSAGKAEEESA